MGVSRNSWCPNLDENVKQYLHICYDMILRDIILCERDVGESHVCMHVHSNMYILLTCMAPPLTCKSDGARCARLPEGLTIEQYIARRTI